MYQVYTVMSYELLLSLFGQCIVLAYVARIYANYAICTQFGCPKLVHMITCSFIYIVLHVWLCIHHVVEP